MAATEPTTVAFFSIPKPFDRENSPSQRNAIQSWLVSTPGSSVYLFGRDRGVAEFCQDNAIVHVPSISVSDYGTPLVSDAFTWMRHNTSVTHLCYANADVIFLDDLSQIIARVIRPISFLLAGQRWDVDSPGEVDFSDDAWDRRLWENVEAGAGRLHPPGGLDYFVFPRHVDWGMPDLVVGRPGWDNWLLFRARQLRLPLIDSTKEIRVLHQDHSYSHVPAARGAKWEGPEADFNLRSIADQRPSGLFGLWAATHQMTPGGPRRPKSLVYLLRQAYVFAFLRPPLAGPAGVILRALRRIGLRSER
jgi:hypothetical protein